MNPAWTDVWQAVGSVGSLIATVLGFTLVLYQVRELRKAIYSETHGKLYAEDLEIIRIFLEKPYLRPYFYDDREIEAGNKHYVEALAVAEMFCSHFEHAMLQLDNLPKPVRQSWKDYAQAMYRTSPITRQYYTDKGLNEGWFMPLTFLAGEAKKSASTQTKDVLESEPKGTRHAESA